MDWCVSGRKLHHVVVRKKCHDIFLKWNFVTFFIFAPGWYSLVTCRAFPEELEVIQKQLNKVTQQGTSRGLKEETSSKGTPRGFLEGTFVGNLVGSPGDIQKTILEGNQQKPLEGIQERSHSIKPFFFFCTRVKKSFLSKLKLEEIYKLALFLEGMNYSNNSCRNPKRSCRRNAGRRNSLKNSQKEFLITSQRKL